MTSKTIQYHDHDIALSKSRRNDGDWINVEKGVLKENYHFAIKYGKKLLADWSFTTEVVLHDYEVVEREIENFIEKFRDPAFTDEEREDIYDHLFDIFDIAVKSMPPLPKKKKIEIKVKKEEKKEEKYYLYTSYNEEIKDTQVVRRGKYGHDRHGGSVDLFISKNKINESVEIPKGVINLEAVALSSYDSKANSDFFNKAFKILPKKGYKVILNEDCVVYFFEKDGIDYDNIETYEKMGIDYDDLEGSIEQVHFK